MYKLEGERFIELQPGEELVLTYKSGWSEFDYQSYVEQGSHSFQKGFHQWLVIQYGSPYHDSATDAVGISPCSVDIVGLTRFRYHCRYAGDAKDTFATNSLGTVTAAYQVDPFAPLAQTGAGP